MLNKDFYYGEDKSDLPQTLFRESLETDGTWKPRIDPIPATVPSDFDRQRLPKFFNPRKIEIINVPETDMYDPVILGHLALFRSAQEYDRHEASKQSEFEETRTLQFIADTAVDKNLDQLIEECYQAAAARLQAKFDEPC